MRWRLDDRIETRINWPVVTKKHNSLVQSLIDTEQNDRWLANKWVDMKQANKTILVYE